MKLLLVVSGLSSLAATAAYAGPVAIPSPLAEPSHAHRRPVNLRLVQDRVSEPGPIHVSGMIAQRAIGPNAILGVGLFKMAPKKLGSGDWRVDGTQPKSRKAAVSFIVKF